MSVSAAQIRRGLIAKIHIARKQLGLTEQSYRDILWRVTGKSSCADMDDPELEKVIREFRHFGFNDKVKPRRAGKRSMASQPQAKKIRAMWITLHQMGEVRDPSEDALAAFVEKTTGITSLQWVHEADANKVINALRGWIRRAGGDA